MKYYIADTHFGDEAVIGYSHRPFSSVKEMDEAMIQNWNAKVNDDDDVYIIGDLVYRTDDPLLYLDRLQGRLHLICGNHDRQVVDHPIGRERFTEIEEYAVVDDGRHRIVLFHYPILEWEGYYYGTWHMFGHIHNHPNPTQDYLKDFPKALNVGVDVVGFAPVTFDEAVEANRKFYDRPLSSDKN